MCVRCCVRDDDGSPLACCARCVEAPRSSGESGVAVGATADGHGRHGESRGSRAAEAQRSGCGPVASAQHSTPAASLCAVSVVSVRRVRRMGAARRSRPHESPSGALPPLRVLRRVSTPKSSTASRNFNVNETRHVPSHHDTFIIIEFEIRPRPERNNTARSPETRSRGEWRRPQGVPLPGYSTRTVGCRDRPGETTCVRPPRIPARRS